MENSNAEKNWSACAKNAAFSDLNTKLNDSVNKLYCESDENKNSAYLVRDNAIRCPTDNSIASLVPEMKNLRMARQEKEPEYVAGYIKAVIPLSRTLVIQHAPGSKILDIGTAIFTRKSNAQNYEEIGLISDIFGSINNPMYAVLLKRKAESDFFKLDSKVFYLYGHPNTRFVSVQCDGNNRYTVMYS
ncbi:uncharacterized protein LOC131663561 [Phymastichus coffea]|uniref:uncharacterized protein LOC131663561 n=1 Tax=Phymastichus coffea TaxID=108790 RepID=UPI00273ABB4A|nr:uncharacterized protein LOC131663561 [Phymastichus coffea]